MKKENDPDWRRLFLNEYPPIEDIPSYTLSNLEMLCIEEVARMIDEVAPRRGMPGKSFNTGSEDGLQSNITGEMGEWTYSKHYGPEYSPVIDPQGDNGIDYTVIDTLSGDEVTVSVKTSDHRLRDLMVPVRDELIADCYFRMQRRGRQIGIVGFAKRKEVENADIKTFQLGGKEGEEVDFYFIEEENLYYPPEPDIIMPLPE